MGWHNFQIRQSQVLKLVLLFRIGIIFVLKRFIIALIPVISFQTRPSGPIAPSILPAVPGSSVTSCIDSSNASVQLPLSISINHFLFRRGYYNKIPSRSSHTCTVSVTRSRNLTAMISFYRPKHGLAVCIRSSDERSRASRPKMSFSIRHKEGKEG